MPVENKGPLLEPTVPPCLLAKKQANNSVFVLEPAGEEIVFKGFPSVCLPNILQVHDD